MVSARVTSLIAAGVTAVGTSGTLLSAPPLRRAQAPAKVLGRGGVSSLFAISSSPSSSRRLPAAMASVSSTVMGGPPSGAGWAPS